MCLGRDLLRTNIKYIRVSYEYTANRDTAVCIWTGYILLGITMVFL